MRCTECGASVIDKRADVVIAWEKAHRAFHADPKTGGDGRKRSPQGSCVACDRPVTGERRYCGPCLARRT